MGPFFMFLSLQHILERLSTYSHLVVIKVTDIPVFRDAFVAKGSTFIHERV